VAALDESGQRKACEATAGSSASTQGARAASVLVLPPQPRRASVALAFQPRLERDLLDERCGTAALRVRAAPSQLSIGSWMDRDLAEAAYFHRELPCGVRVFEEFNPRL
jgi:hypothetical protein